ncbi:helix-turn-helix domain-containing protein [Variovorax dokdonensis]|uniref:Helix-turn-helix domain-containing protein n=1 Tax=Variovorax dokdonensis TaxID=344883 RepID=A0ABT7N8I3_9BURK|nr:helix-turn-helix domain-containing protein [Variovorax dokdonensis]MDM0044251.1 helix-turn-helix domain-containing protein [Variovorax dokdonensis]
MDISEVARRSGVPASTLRYYGEKGLISPLGEQGARRRYAPEVLDQLALIALGQAAGFALDEIRSMFLPNGEPDIDRRLLATKADEIDRTVARLRAMSRSLKHAAVCPAPRHAECPSFQKLLKAAASDAKASRPGRNALSRT